MTTKTNAGTNAGERKRADICPECKCAYPGHRIDCKTDNDRARKSQAAFAAKYRAARKRTHRKAQP